MTFWHILLQIATHEFFAILLAFFVKTKKTPCRVIIHFTPARAFSKKYRFLNFKNRRHS